MTIINPVQQIVLNCLNHFAYQDAIFLSERMHSEVQTEETLYLLALSHYKSGCKSLRAYHLLKERQLKLPKSKYLLGKCCLDLDKFSEAESVLISDFLHNFNSSSSSANSAACNISSNVNPSNSNSSSNSAATSSKSASTLPSTSSNNTQSTSTINNNSSKQKLYDEIVKEYGAEYSSHVLQILATVYSKTDRVSQAVEFYKKSLRLNPFMWSSFEAICNIGDKVDPAKYFSLNSALNAYKAQILDSNSLNIFNNQPTTVSSQKSINLLQQQQPLSQPQMPQIQILKQIDPQSDLFDQKNRQEIANILKMLESDPSTKFSHNKQPKYHHHHHHHCIHQGQQQQQQQLTNTKSNYTFCGSFAYKENNSEEQTVSNQQQTNISQTTESVTECCNCCCHCATNTEQTVSLGLENNANRLAVSSKQTKPMPSHLLYDHLNPATSSISLLTPPQLISSNNLNIGPPQKKCNNKRQTQISAKPLFGQNTTNNLSKNQTVSNLSYSNTSNTNSNSNNTTISNSNANNNTNSNSSSSSAIRRSSRIIAAQTNAAVKENKKHHASSSGNEASQFEMAGSNSAATSTSNNPLTLQTLTSSQSSQSSSSSSVSSNSSQSSSSSSSNSSSSKTGKRLKIKKKLDQSTSGNDMMMATEDQFFNKLTEESSSNLNIFKLNQVDCNSCGIYTECRHCNLLSNQTKNNYLNSYSIPYNNNSTSSGNQTTNQTQSAAKISQSGLRKKGNKINVLIEQSICLDNLMKLLKDIGMAIFNLKQYECEKSLQYFEQLPQSQIQSSFILSNMARAHFELHNYSKAEKLYLQLRREYPYHLEGLEYYSTTLWHLQKEIALSALAQELTEYDKLSPETWCVVGNCFSLHKEHDAAIKFFQRATQVDPKFAYAYNLLGHEYFLIEEMDKGLSCFRKAIFLDSRHYNAWYGISMIHLKQEKFLLAEKYLKKALLINPHSSTLMCHIAVVYHSLKQSEKALEILDRALSIDPKNTLCKFHRANILFSMEKYEESLDEFEKLRRVIPKESLIYYMISKTHKKLKNVHLSLMYMSWAMDLDPKGVNNQLKESIDKRYVVDSDSTFARELETINTSTLDAIYGVNELGQNNENEENDEDLEESTNSRLLNSNQQEQAADESDLLITAADDNSNRDDSEMSRNITTNNVASTNRFNDLIQDSNLEANSSSAITTSLLEASNLISDQLMDPVGTAVGVGTTRSLRDLDDQSSSRAPTISDTENIDHDSNSNSNNLSQNNERIISFDRNFSTRRIASSSNLNEEEDDEEDDEDEDDEDEDEDIEREYIARMDVKNIIGDFDEVEEEEDDQENIDEDEEDDDEEDDDDDDDDDDDEDDDDDQDDQDDNNNNGDSANNDGGSSEPNNDEERNQNFDDSNYEDLNTDNDNNSSQTNNNNNRFSDSTKSSKMNLNSNHEVNSEDQDQDDEDKEEGKIVNRMKKQSAIKTRKRLVKKDAAAEHSLDLMDHQNSSSNSCSSLHATKNKKSKQAKMISQDKKLLKTIWGKKEFIAARASSSSANQKLKSAKHSLFTTSQSHQELSENNASVKPILEITAIMQSQLEEDNDSKFTPDLINNAQTAMIIESAMQAPIRLKTQKFPKDSRDEFFRAKRIARSLLTTDSITPANNFSSTSNYHQAMLNEELTNVKQSLLPSFESTGFSKPIKNIKNELDNCRNDDSLHHNRDADESASFISMTAFDTTKNNETISFLSQSNLTPMQANDVSQHYERTSLKKQDPLNLNSHRNFILNTSHDQFMDS